MYNQNDVLKLELKVEGKKSQARFLLICQYHGRIKGLNGTR